MPLHLKANKGDYAPTTLLVGDPGRAELIGKALENTKLVNDNRGLIGYTGCYKGKPVSVQTTGIGCPSAAIVVEELIQCDVQTLIRVGTCGGIGKDIKPLDIIAAVSAAPYDGATRVYVQSDPHAPYASFEILKIASNVADQAGIKVRFGGVASVDVFYNPFPDYIERLRIKGICAVEMETSLIYALANRHNLRAVSFLLVSDIVGGGEGFTEYVTDEALKAGTKRIVDFSLEVFYNL